ncbi:MAG: hypothetical protein LBK07_04685 [Tannerella sp.]|jgi:hypothetical protein|nr:hypothetical protein [Tannerella sp.]
MDFFKNKSIYSRIIEILSFLVMLWSLAPLLLCGKIAEENPVPIHYNIKGQIDRWGNRSHITTFSLLSLAFYVFLSILQKYPMALNYPVKITPVNAESVYRLGVTLVRHLKLFLVLMFGYLNNVTFAIAIGKSNGISNSILISLIAMFFLCTIAFSVKIRKYR